jgi:aspartate racemase
MRTIGLLGGMSWESSIEYERIINLEIQRRLAGVHSAALVLISYDFAGIERLQREGRWRDVGELAYFPTTRLHALAAVDADLAP